MKRFSSILLSAAVTLGLASPLSAAKKVHTIGDSTMANYNESSTVTRGWCQYLQQFLEGIEVNNRGKNGASSKSFYKEAAYWTSVKKQLQPGDYVVIQFSHNDEKTSGMDGDELKAYYTSVGNTAAAASTDYRGTTPSGTYKEYLRKYVNESRAAGCTPILVAPVCRMYFSGNSIKRNGRHDLGDKFSVLTADGVKANQKVAASDHSMDYPYQMKLVAEELDVPFIDLTTATAELFVSYGDSDCHSILGDGDGSTHLSATGATLIARRFVQLCQEAGLLTEYANITSELSVSPAKADLGQGYVGQALSKEFMLTGFGLNPASGKINISTEGDVEISADKQTWNSTLDLNYVGGTVITRFYARMTVAAEGKQEAKVNIKAGDKSTVIPVSVTGVDLGNGTEFEAFWPLTDDDKCTTTGPVTAIPESWHGMKIQKYSAPNANTTWPASSGFDTTRKTQRNVIDNEEAKWPAGEIDEVSTRYIEFGVTAPENTNLTIDEISYYVCGAGGGKMCLHVYYSAEDDFSNANLIMSQQNMPANNMQDGTVKNIIKLAPGKSLRLRFYPWQSGETFGKTLCLSNVRFHGFASAEGESSITDVAASGEALKTVYYNLQGMEVANPSAGNVYIVRSVYADGSVSTDKIVK